MTARSKSAAAAASSGEAAAPPSSAAAPSAIQREGGGEGGGGDKRKTGSRKEWTIGECHALLDVVEKILPLGDNHWKNIAQEHNARSSRVQETSRHQERDYRSLRRKFDVLATVPTARPTAGDADPHEELVRRAKSIARKIGRKAGFTGSVQNDEEDIDRKKSGDQGSKDPAGRSQNVTATHSRASSSTTERTQGVPQQRPKQQQQQQQRTTAPSSLKQTARSAKRSIALPPSRTPFAEAMAKKRKAAAAAREEQRVSKLGKVETDSLASRHSSYSFNRSCVNEDLLVRRITNEIDHKLNMLASDLRSDQMLHEGRMRLMLMQHESSVGWQLSSMRTTMLMIMLMTALVSRNGGEGVTPAMVQQINNIMMPKPSESEQQKDKQPTGAESSAESGEKSKK